MLEINKDICVLKEEEISIEKVFNCFFEIDSNIIYIVDTMDKFIGIITSGGFLKHLKKENEIFINQSSSTIFLKEEKEIFKEAEFLFEKKNITTAIPILDQNRKICYEIRKKRETLVQEICTEFYEKFRKYEKSHYVGNEVKYIRKVLEDQDIIIIGTEEQFGHICGGLFLDTSRVSFKEKLDNPYEFMCHNKNLLIDVSLADQIARNDIYEICCLGYGWNEFLHTIMYIVECEYCSRFHQIIERKNCIAKEYIEKYWGKEISVPLKGIFVSALKKYLEKVHFRFKIKENLCKEESFRIDYQANGMTYKVKFAKDLMVLDYIDQVIQFYDLNRRLSEWDIPVLNFAYDSEAHMTGEEKARTEQEFNFSKYVLEIKVSVDNKSFLYQGSICDDKSLVELDRDLSFYQIKRFENDLIVYRDYASRLVNIENGIRKTCYQPKEYIGTVYFLGPCTIYGLYVEDNYTIPSIVQKYINISGKKYRVVNLGNQIQVNSSRLIEALTINENDIFVLFFHSVVTRIKKNISIIEVGEQFDQLRKSKYQDKECFFDGVHHCGDNANIIYAEIIYSEVKKYLSNAGQKSVYKNSIYNVFKKNEMDLSIFYGWNLYVKELKEKKKMCPKNSKKIGCVVVNCNPFTKGHRYLMEYALTVVDFLYVFVLEEDKSFFTFKDRYEMVRRGIHDLKKAMVVRSGKFVISSATFPAYFQKDRIKKEEKISLNEDLRIFGQYIASVLDIQYRFVGEEPQDYVTNQYNNAMKKILPEFGINVIEIPRKCEGENVISASKVREYYCKKKFDAMKKLIPESTLDYLIKLSNINIKQ